MRKASISYETEVCRRTVKQNNDYRTDILKQMVVYLNEGVRMSVKSDKYNIDFKNGIELTPHLVNVSLFTISLNLRQFATYTLFYF